MKSFAISDMGKVRNLNEDAVFVCDESIGNLDNLYIVADGMGGHQAGEYASAYAIARSKRLVEKHPEFTKTELFTWVYNLVNQEIYEKGKLEASKAGMGTTLVTCTIDQDYQITVANVGDSRLYICHKDGSIVQITKDHSYVEELVRKGQMERGSEEYLNARNLITRAMGAESTVETDIYQLELEECDQILLCSDGLSNMVTDERLSEILMTSESLEEKAAIMVQEANAAGGPDNISVILIAPFAPEKVSSIGNDTENEQEMRGL